MNRKTLFFIFVLGMAALNLGTVRRTEDPIRDTQTNPILYQQKMEEEKDGKKGPLLYHVKNSPRETFFIDPPYEAVKKSSDKKTLADEVPSSANTTDWWEEQPTNSPAPAPSSVETVAEPLPEPLPKEEKAQDLETTSQSAPEAEAGKAPSGKKDDYWW